LRAELAELAELLFFLVGIFLCDLFEVGMQVVVRYPTASSLRSDDVGFPMLDVFDVLSLALLSSPMQKIWASSKTHPPLSVNPRFRSLALPQPGAKQTNLFEGRGTSSMFSFLRVLRVLRGVNS